VDYTLYDLYYECAVLLNINLIWRRLCWQARLEEEKQNTCVPSKPENSKMKTVTGRSILYRPKYKIRTLSQSMISKTSNYLVITHRIKNIPWIKQKYFMCHRWTVTITQLLQLLCKLFCASDFIADFPAFHFKSDDWDDTLLKAFYTNNGSLCWYARYNSI